MVVLRQSGVEGEGASPQAQRLVTDFCARVPQSRSKFQEDSYRGDQLVLASRARPAHRQLSHDVLAKNYFSRYLDYHCRDTIGGDDEVQAFMQAKLERQRFTQHRGERIRACRSASALRAPYSRPSLALCAHCRLMMSFSLHRAARGAPHCAAVLCRPL